MHAHVPQFVVHQHSSGPGVSNRSCLITGFLPTVSDTSSVSAAAMTRLRTAAGLGPFSGRAVVEARAM